MEKFNKSWHLYFEIGKIDSNGSYLVNETFSIGYPLTCDFNINKNFSSYTNTAVITVFGLNEITRTKLYHNLVVDNTKFINVVLTAGYNGNEYVIFKGRVIEGYSGKQGRETEYKTVLTCDSLFQLNANRIFGTYNSGTPYRTIIEDVSKKLHGISFDSKFLEKFKNKKLLKSYSFIKSPREVIQDLTNGNYYEDNGIIYIVSDEFESPILKISSESGLLGSPIITNLALRNLRILFEPQIGMGNIILYESSLPDFKKYNGIYKVMSLKHSGVISGGVQSNVITELSLYTNEANKIQFIEGFTDDTISNNNPA